MHHKYSIATILLLLPLISLLSSCKKYLDAKPNLALEVPATVSDLQALLNNTIDGSPTPEVGSDDYYLKYPNWESILGTNNQYNYYWSGPDQATWQLIYSQIYNDNIVLDNLATVSLGDSSSASLTAIKGEALFQRAISFFFLSEVYGQPYKAQSATTDLGICLRLTSSVTTPSTRSTVQEEYNQIIADLKTAAKNLPTQVQYPVQPSKQAAYGFLSRVYLSMSDYINAEAYADSTLAINSQLINFNSLSPSVTYPIQMFNVETVYYCVSFSSGDIANSRALIDTTLYSSYTNQDLRKTIYFKSSSLGGFIFRGGYNHNQSAYVFDGIATDEIFLIKSECEARRNDISDAMTDLNTLLLTRWLSSTFVPYTATTEIDALQQILTERRKELIWRGTRWSDLRRLNQDPNQATTITRNLNGTIYTLAPNDLRYTYLIPPNVISLGNIQQNP